jgi:hypothetical protein
MTGPRPHLVMRHDRDIRPCTPAPAPISAPESPSGPGPPTPLPPCLTPSGSFIDDYPADSGSPTCASPASCCPGRGPRPTRSRRNTRALALNDGVRPVSPASRPLHHDPKPVSPARRGQNPPRGRLASRYGRNARSSAPHARRRAWPAASGGHRSDVDSQMDPKGRKTRDEFDLFGSKTTESGPPQRVARPASSFDTAPRSPSAAFLAAKSEARSCTPRPIVG